MHQRQKQKTVALCDPAGRSLWQQCFLILSNEVASGLHSAAQNNSGSFVNMSSKKSKAEGASCMDLLDSTPPHPPTPAPPVINATLISETESKNVARYSSSCSEFLNPSVCSAGTFSPVSWLCLLPKLVLPGSRSTWGFGAVCLYLPGARAGDSGVCSQLVAGVFRL